MRVVFAVYLPWPMAHNPRFESAFWAYRHGYRSRHRRGHRRGVALLSVMLMLALLATLAIYSADNENIQIRRLHNLDEAEQGFQVAMGGELWSIKTLQQDLVEDLQNGQAYFDHGTEAWASGFVINVATTESVVRIAIEDAQGKFNLNNLTQPLPPPAELNQPGQKTRYWYQVFQSLLANIGLPSQLAEVVVDWVDADQHTRGADGAEDLYYQGLPQPYRAANRPLSSIAELPYLKGFTPEVVRALSPYVTALPRPTEAKGSASTTTKINVNTAPLPVLAALLAVQPSAVERLAGVMQARTVQPYRRIEDFIASLDTQIIGIPVATVADLIDVKSHYYFSHSCAATGRLTFNQRSLLLKQPAAQNVKVLSRHRTFGCSNRAQPPRATPS